jgi:hypothetical protein
MMDGFTSMLDPIRGSTDGIKETGKKKERKKNLKQNHLYVVGRRFSYLLFLFFYGYQTDRRKTNIPMSVAILAAF